jgi:CO dehydrogenase maturation factor
VSPEQLLGQIESNGDIVVADFEAGLGTLSRMESGNVDILLVIVEPTQKSIQVGRRALAIISERQLGRSILVANRVANREDRELIEMAFPDHEVVFVPEDPGLRKADMEGQAPFDAVPDSPAVGSIRELAFSLFD